MSKITISKKIMKINYVFFEHGKNNIQVNQLIIVKNYKGIIGINLKFKLMVYLTQLISNTNLVTIKIRIKNKELFLCILTIKE